MNLKSFAKASRQMLNRNASKILAGFAIGAGVMAVGFAIEATPKAMILLEEKKAELGVEKLDAKTIVKTAGANEAVVLGIARFTISSESEEFRNFDSMLSEIAPA